VRSRRSRHRVRPRRPRAQISRCRRTSRRHRGSNRCQGLRPFRRVRLRPHLRRLLLRTITFEISAAGAEARVRSPSLSRQFDSP
jgi:hypothetical protein